MGELYAVMVFITIIIFEKGEILVFSKQTRTASILRDIADGQTDEPSLVLSLSRERKREREKKRER